MRRNLLYFFIYVSLFCIIVRQVQAQGTPPSQPVRVDVPSVGSANLPTLPPNQGSPAGGPTAAASATAGKYYEYQSYCRQPLQFPNILSDENYNKAVTALKQTFNNQKTFTHLESIVNFFIQENHTKDAKDFITVNQSLLTPVQDKALQARVLIAEKRYRDAINILNSLPDENKNELLPLLEYSQAYRKMNNLFEAKSALQDAIKLDRKNANKYLLDLCIMETEDSNHGEVDVVCPKVSKVFPKDYLSLVYLGISQRERLNYKEAQKYFEQSAQIQKNEFALSCLGEVFFLQKNLGKAIEAFKNATAVEPRSGRAQLGAAQSLYQMQRYEEALPYYSKACLLDRSSTLRFREAQQPLEAAKLKVSTTYYNEIEKCMARPK